MQKKVLKPRDSLHSFLKAWIWVQERNPPTLPNKAVRFSIHFVRSLGLLKESANTESLPIGD